MKDNNYYVIHGWMINKLGLAGNELIIYAIIYGFSQDGESKYSGANSYLQKATGASKSTVKRVLSSLVEQQLIKKFPKKINGVSLNDYAFDPGGVKMNQGWGQNEPGGGVKMNPHNIEDIDTDKKPPIIPQGDSEPHLSESAEKPEAEQGSLQKSSAKKGSATPGERKRAAEEFERFFEHYPRKTAKTEAKRRFIAVYLKGEIDTDAMIEHINRMLDSGEWINTKEGRNFIPHAATYINQRRWLDDDTTETKQPAEKVAWEKCNDPEMMMIYWIERTLMNGIPNSEMMPVEYVKSKCDSGELEIVSTYRKWRDQKFGGNR